MKSIQMNCDLILRMKLPWFLPNVVEIWSTFIKLQTKKKQSGLSFLAYPV